MNRNTTIEICGRVYPARFGVQASKAIDEKFGGLEKMGDKFQEGTMSEKMDAIIFVLEAVIRQGCAYKNLFEADLPKIEGAYIVDGKYAPITKEELEVAITFEDFSDLAQQIFALIRIGNRQTVETEAKNAEAK